MPKKTTSVAPAQQAEEPKKVILIVDDEFDLTSTFSLLFQLNGFETFTANHGQQALELIRQRAPDIILSDYMMPVMDGVQLSQQLRADPATAQIPMILMSAIPQHDDLIDSGFSAFMQKPFQFKKLLETVLRVLSSQQEKNIPPK